MTLNVPPKSGKKKLAVLFLLDARSITIRKCVFADQTRSL